MPACRNFLATYSTDMCCSSSGSHAPSPRGRNKGRCNGGSLCEACTAARWLFAGLVVQASNFPPSSKVLEGLKGCTVNTLPQHLQTHATHLLLPAGPGRRPPERSACWEVGSESRTCVRGDRQAGGARVSIHASSRRGGKGELGTAKDWEGLMHTRLRKQK
jgi:hypothetical protein